MNLFLYLERDTKRGGPRHPKRDHRSIARGFASPSLEIHAAETFTFRVLGATFFPQVPSVPAY
jgi:hypothetical protein